MSYKELYDYCQTLTPKISREQIKKKVLEITGSSIRIMKTTLDTEICRGYYLSGKNVEHPIVKQFGSNVIVMARGLNNCWERFVYVKELMHLFDEPEEFTSSSVEFDRLLTDLQSLGTMELSVQAVSDAKCLWMALAAFCPEALRKQFEQQRNAKLVDDYSIALQLKIPTQYVPLLFDDRYTKTLSAILGSPSLVKAATA